MKENKKSSHEIFVKNKFKIVSKIIKENSKILDVGCNDAGIRKYLGKIEYFGIDGNKNKISLLKKQGIRVEAADLNKKIPFEKVSFDYILLLDILEHWVDPRETILNLKKRLVKNGKIIINLPNDYHILNKIRFLFNQHLTEDPFDPYGHLHYFPIKSGELFLKKCGILIEKKIFLGPVKPSIVPTRIKNFLARTFPQMFSRGTLYLARAK